MPGKCSPKSSVWIQHVIDMPVRNRVSAQLTGPSTAHSLGSHFPSPTLPTPTYPPTQWNWIHEVELKFACISFWLQILGLTVTTIYHHYWNKMGWPRIKINVKKRWEREMRNAWGTNQILLEKANSVPMWSMRMVFPAAYTKCHCKWLKSGFFFPTLHVCPSIRVIVASPGTSCCRELEEETPEI